MQRLRTAVEEHGGYVSEARVHGGPHRSASLEARVPRRRSRAFRAAVASVGEVVDDAEKAEDVAEQRADIGARLRNARAQEKRLLDLLSDRTGSLADVVAVEQLGSVRETIEQIEAQERLLEGQIAYATVKMSITARGEEQTWGRRRQDRPRGQRGNRERGGRRREDSGPRRVDRPHLAAPGGVLRGALLRPSRHRPAAAAHGSQLPSALPGGPHARLPERRAAGAGCAAYPSAAPPAQGAQLSPEPTSPPPAQGPRGDGEIGPG